MSLATAVVGGLGLDTSNYSIPYIASWSQNDDSLDIVETCAGVIDRVAKRIEDAIGDPPAEPVTKGHSAADRSQRHKRVRRAFVIVHRC